MRTILLRHLGSIAALLLGADISSSSHIAALSPAAPLRNIYIVIMSPCLGMTVITLSIVMINRHHTNLSLHHHCREELWDSDANDFFMRGEILKLETHGQTQYLWMGMTKCRGLAGLERPCVGQFHHSLSCQ